MRIQNQNRPCIPFDYYTFIRKLKTSPDPQSVNGKFRIENFELFNF